MVVAGFAAALTLVSVGSPAASDSEAGAIRTAPGELQSDEWLMAVFSEGGTAHVGNPLWPDQLPGSPIEGCLSVVSISSSDGRLALNYPAHLSFDCPEAPDGSVVFGWIDNHWKPLPTRRDKENRPAAGFRTLTLYGLFEAPRTPQPSLM